MSKNTEIIKSLNELLFGEYMAVESFNNFISKTVDENTKKGLQEVQKNHRNNIDILVNYIQNIGGQPEENTGIRGKMAGMKLSMDLGFKHDSKEILEKAIEGETQGVNMAEKVLRGNLDDNSRQVAGQILENDRSAIDKLRRLH